MQITIFQFAKAIIPLVPGHDRIRNIHVSVIETYMCQ